MPEVLLLVFEGEKTEKQIFENLMQHHDRFRSGSRVIQTAYCAEIYQLYQEISKDEYLDLFALLKEKFKASEKEVHRKCLEQLAEIDSEQVDQIYLFFDYDGHAQARTDSCDTDIEQMLANFDNETENGKLYISYPMVESLKHVKQGVDFNTVTVNAKNKIACDVTQRQYKQLVAESTDYQDFTRYQHDDWRQLNVLHINKANYIVTQSADKPETYAQVRQLSQEVIFAKQLAHYIQPYNKVAVLSGFPFFIIDYFGEKDFKWWCCVS